MFILTCSRVVGTIVPAHLFVAHGATSRLSYHMGPIIHYRRHGCPCASLLVPCINRLRPREQSSAMLSHAIIRHQRVPLVVRRVATCTAGG
jgi:hypothetical protein